jgi:hypothetical protein
MRNPSCLIWCLRQAMGRVVPARNVLRTSS